MSNPTPAPLPFSDKHEKWNKTLLSFSSTKNTPRCYTGKWKPCPHRTEPWHAGWAGPPPFQSVCDLELLLPDASLSSVEIIERPFRWSTSAIQDNVSGFPPLLRWQRWQPCLRCLSTYTHSKSSLCPHLPHLKAYQRRRKWDFHYKEVSSWSYRSKSYSNRRCQTSFWTQAASKEKIRGSDALLHLLLFNRCCIIGQLRRNLNRQKKAKSLNFCQSAFWSLIKTKSPTQQNLKGLIEK